MLVYFSKMHGLGNDFVVIDLISQRYRAKATDMKKIGDRHFGIGCDQILLVEAPERPENDFKYRIFNGDGSEVQQCGNGARCFARFVQYKGLTAKSRIKVETQGGDIELNVQGENVEVNMGAPKFTPQSLPLLVEHEAPEYSLEAAGETLRFGAVSMGNPHAVIQIDDINSDIVSRLGPVVESHQLFPQRVNAGFMQVVDAHNIKLRVYERGAGETLACGTGACAAAVFGIRQGLLQSPVAVELPGGKLTISWQGEGQPVMMTGPASFVFDGKIRL